MGIGIVAAATVTVPIGTSGTAVAATPVVSVAKTVIGVVEGNAGSTDVGVTVSLSAATASTVTVAYATADGTAKVATADYVATSGTVTFLPGELSHQITVAVNGDTALEDYELLNLRLSAPTNAGLGNAVERIQIRNDELPKLTVGSVTVVEGQPAVFRPKLLEAYYLPVTLTATTTDGTAVSPSDFSGVDGPVVVATGTKTAPPVNVATVADGSTEPTETFSLSVTSPSIVAGTIKTGTITGQLCRNVAPPAQYQHVIVVVMENKKYADVIGNAAAPWSTRIAKGCTTAKAYAQAASPSRPNYLAMTAGSIFDCANSNADPSAGSCNPTSDSVFKQVIDSGGAALSFAEGMTGNCDLVSHGTYAVKHNPWPYFAAEASLCQQFDQPLPASIDVNNLPTLLAVFPDLCHDSHDCTVAVGDAWLQQYLQPVLDSAAYLNGSTAVIVTYDEYTSMPNLFASQSVKAGTSVATATSHYGLLRTIEDMLGLAPLGQAATATSLRTAMHL